MKQASISRLTWMACALLMTLTTSCYRSTREVWEDTKTCSRYMGRGVRSLFGQHIDPREYADYEGTWEREEDPFIPIAGGEAHMHSLGIQDLGAAIPPPKDSPGDPGSPIPGIEAFTSPMGSLASLFKPVHFETDLYSVKGEENVHALRDMATFLAKNPHTYLFVEGHADERGASAYNLALGSRRANAIRAFLIQHGASPDQLFTISYGKERPVVQGHDDLSWQKNRRGQFKIYAQK